MPLYPYEATVVSPRFLNHQPDWQTPDQNADMRIAELRETVVPVTVFCALHNWLVASLPHRTIY